MQSEVCTVWYPICSDKVTSHGLARHKCKKKVRCEFCSKKVKLYKISRHQETCEALLKILQPELKPCPQCRKEIPVPELPDHLLAHELEKNMREPPVRAASQHRERPAPRNLTHQIIEIIREHGNDARNIGLRIGVRFNRRSSLPQKNNNKPKPDAVKRLPVSRFEDTGSEVICTICLNKFKRGKRIRTLPCFHQFHRRCIDTWLETSCLCPICKGSI